LMPDDIDIVGFLDEFPQAEVALLAQGLQRAVVPDGRSSVAHRAQPSSVLLDAARPNVTIFLSREETRLWAAGVLEHLAVRAGRVRGGGLGAAQLPRPSPPPPGGRGPELAAEGGGRRKSGLSTSSTSGGRGSEPEAEGGSDRGVPSGGVAAESPRPSPPPQGG